MPLLGASERLRVPFQSRRARLVIEDDQRGILDRIARSRSESAQRVERARILLAYAGGQTVSAIARELGTNRPKVERCVDKGLQMGPLAALGDLPRSGRPARIPAAARAWVASLANTAPGDWGYAERRWTHRLLARHAREHGESAGHPSLARLASGTVSKILRQARPSDGRRGVEGPERAAMGAQVLVLRQWIQLEPAGGTPPDGSLTARVWPAGRPGDAPEPRPALSLVVGLDLATAQACGALARQHGSRDFVAFLERLDRAYAPGVRVRLLLDRHAAHRAAATRRYLARTSNRFELAFRPRHGSWQALVEALFARLAHALLSGARLRSADDVQQRIERSLAMLNASRPSEGSWDS